MLSSNTVHLRSHNYSTVRSSIHYDFDSDQWYYLYLLTTCVSQEIYNF